MSRETKSNKTPNTKKPHTIRQTNVFNREMNFVILALVFSFSLSFWCVYFFEHTQTVLSFKIPYLCFTYTEFSLAKNILMLIRLIRQKKMYVQKIQYWIKTTEKHKYCNSHLHDHWSQALSVSSFKCNNWW